MMIRVYRWALMTIISWAINCASLWGQVQTSPPVPLIPSFYGSALEWWIPFNPPTLISDVANQWNSLGFLMARAFINIPRVDWGVSALDFIIGNTPSSLWLHSGDGYNLRIYGGVPWSTMGSLFVEDIFFKWFIQNYGSCVPRVITYEPFSETDSGFYRGQLIDVDKAYQLSLIDYSLARAYFPNAKLAMPAPTNANRGNLDYLHSLLKRGFANIADYATVHPYRYTTPESLIPFYANARSLVASYTPADRVLPLIASELGYGIDAIHPNPTIATWGDLLPPGDWYTRRWAKYWQRLLLVQRYANVPVAHLYQYIVYSSSTWDGLFFPLVVCDVSQGQNQAILHETLAFYSVLNFMDFYMRYEYYTRIPLPHSNPDLSELVSNPSKWVLVFRSRKPSPSGLRRNEWLIVAWDRESDSVSNNDFIVLPIYGAKGIIHNFISKVAPHYESLYYPQSFEYSPNTPLKLEQFYDVRDSAPSGEEDPHPINSYHDASPFYYVLERFEASSLPELAWRITEHVNARAGGSLEITVEGFCPRFWNGTRPNQALLTLRGHGVALSATFPVEPGSWFSRHISLPWNNRRAAVELIAELSFGRGLTFKNLQTKRSIWVSTSNPIDCKIAPMHNGIGLLFTSRDFSQTWSGKVRVKIEIEDAVIIEEKTLMLAPGAQQMVRIMNLPGTNLITNLTIESIHLLDSANRIVGEWGRRYINWFHYNNLFNNYCLPVCTWNGTASLTDRRPDPEGTLMQVTPPVNPPFVDDGSDVQVLNLSYRFGCLSSEREIRELSAALPQSVFVDVDMRTAQRSIPLPSPSQRPVSEICVWIYATEPWIALWARVYDSQPSSSSYQAHETSTFLEGEGRWQLVSFYLPHFRNIRNGLNTEYISSESINSFTLCGINNLYSAGPGELYIGPFALVHYEEEEF